MNQNEIIKLFQSKHWDLWLKRNFPVIIPYLMISGGTRQMFSKYGIAGEFPIILYADGAWRSNAEMFELGGQEAEKYLKQTDARYTTNLCLQAYEKTLNLVDKLLIDKNTPNLEKFSQVIFSLEPLTSVGIWVPHAAEVYYNQEIRRKLAGKISALEIDKFIGDVSFPKRKNAHVLMADDIRAGETTENLLKKYGWMKSRVAAGFAEGYTLAEMENIKKEILSEPVVKVERPPVSADLNYLVSELQEIVYLRAFRTDVLFEIMYRSRPIFAQLEKELDIESIKDYVPTDLLQGRLKKYGNKFSILKYYDDLVVTEETIVNDEVVEKDSVNGAIAWKGKVRGKVKIIFNPLQIDKVEVGDVLVTNMTIPAYLPAMKKAAAFVTDEGGITCHAAIIAREIQKPCIIGTKIATQIFKDGDMVEVDAEQGVVRKLSK